MFSSPGLHKTCLYQAILKLVRILYQPPRGPVQTDLIITQLCILETFSVQGMRIQMYFKLIFNPDLSAGNQLGDLVVIF